MAENQKNTEVQVPTERHAELGRIWEDVFSKLASIESDYIDQGPERSVDYVRSSAIISLQLCCEGIRNSYKILASYDPELRSDLQENLELTLMPTPLAILFLELVELQNDRPSRLLTHHRFDSASEGPYNLSRRFVMAKAVGAVVVLHTTGLKLSEAARRVADTLNEAKFPNPRQKPYSASTVKDWYKRRDKKKGDFLALIAQQQSELEGLREICRQRECNDEQTRANILARLYFFIQAISYDYR